MWGKLNLFPNFSFQINSECFGFKSRRSKSEHDHEVVVLTDLPEVLRGRQPDANGALLEKPPAARPSDSNAFCATLNCLNFFGAAAQHHR